MIKETYKIPAGNLESLTAKIKTLGNRAKKLGAPKIVMTVGDRIEEIEEIKQADGVVCERNISVFFMVTITGETPCIDGWTFLGTIQHGTGELGNIIRAIPGISIPEEFRTADADCEHCRKIRRRNDTFVLRNEVDEYKRVGRNCLGLFLGGRDPHVVAKSAEYLATAAELATSFEEDRESYKPFYYLPDYLGYVAMMMAKHGWLGRGKAYDTNREGRATADRAFFAMTDRKNREGKPSKDDFAAADEAVKWVNEEVAKKDNPSDYEHNMVIICSNKGIDDRGLGIAASILIAHKIDRDRKAKAALKAERNAISKHFGEVKKREDYTLTLIGTSAWEGHYGLTVFYKFVDSTGNIAAWFSSDGTRDLENENGMPMVGSTFKIKGTVKAHSEYDGVKQTVLTRCKVLELLEEAA